MDALNQIQLLAVLVLPMVLGITVHEAAHAWVADRLGDSTARRLGRVTFNPLRHIDPVGTLLVPAASFLLGGILFGWAKPVPVMMHKLRSPRRDMALVAAAGPGANLVMAFLWGLAILLGVALINDYPWVALPLAYMGAAGVLLNVFLMVLNLLPLLPLDGGRVLNALLPQSLSEIFMKVEPYGIFILLALLLSGVLNKILFPLVSFTVHLLPGAGVVAELFPV